jgi:hypothetical protein
MPTEREVAAMAMKEALSEKGDIYGPGPAVQKNLQDAIRLLENPSGEFKPMMKPMTNKQCEWTPDGDGNSDWNTGCKKLFEFSDEGPAENGFEFCPFCGGAIFIQNEADS